MIRTATILGHLVAQKIEGVIAPVVEYLESTVWGQNSCQANVDRQQSSSWGDYNNASHELSGVRRYGSVLQCRL